MLNLAVLFGSRSCEHDVSIVSALQLIEQIDRTQYHIIPIYITREGIWYTGEALLDVKFFEHFDATKVEACLIDPNANSGDLLGVPEKKFLGGGGKRVLAHIDVALPVMHGMNGEDGTLQGLLELANIPYTSCGVLGSAVGMDKIAMKALFRGCGLPVVDSCWFERMDWQKDRAAVLDRCEKELPYPLFVKPANLGSSIGIGRADDRAGLERAIDVAVQYDRRILVECGVTDMIEVNCSALGYGEDVRASVCEQPVTWQELLTFEDKYLGGSKGRQGMESLSRKIPAPISREMSEEVRRMSCDVFRMLDCKGVVRIDYMLQPVTGKLYINEINTIPGSMAFYLWEHEGVSYRELIDRLVDFALRAHVEKNRSVFSFDSQIVKKFQAGGAKGGKTARAAKR